MKIGIISDTHDNLKKISSAVSIFKQEKLDFVVHAGDFVAPFSIAPFMEMGIEWKGVFGNNDGEKNGLAKKSEGRIVSPPLILTLDNVRMVVVHDPNHIENRFFSEYDLIIYGHTHQKQVERREKALVINPGEACGYLTGTATLVILDTDSLEPRFLEIP